MAYMQAPFANSMSSQALTGNAPIDSTMRIALDSDFETNNSHQPIDPWNLCHLFPFFTDLDRPSCCSQHPDATLINDSIPRTDITYPISSSMLQRQESLSDNPSICSSTLSAHGESEYGLDYLPPTPTDGLDQLPPTPPDDAAMFNPFGGSVSQTDYFPLSGPPNPFVKPDELNPFSHPSPLYGDDSCPELPVRCVSMSPNGSYDFDYSIHPESISFTRRMSPAEPAQLTSEQIHVFDMVDDESYSLESEDSQSRSELGVSPVQIQCYDDENDEDDDYAPKIQHRRPATKSSREKGSKRSRKSLETSPAKRIKIEATATAAYDGSAGQPAPKALVTSFPCTQCRDIAFKDESGLRKHIRQQHTRPFVCVFAFAGCDSTFASKNEWKRHVASQHLLLNYWLCRLCRQDARPGTSNVSGTSSRGYSNTAHSQLPTGAIFNRKDLYTQHVRRMHKPAAMSTPTNSIGKQKKLEQEWEDTVRDLQSKGHKIRCELPGHMECPANGCDIHFNGPTAWDERMEHVAKHFEVPESPVFFGGNHDHTLIAWAARADVAIIKADDSGGWRLNNPLKADRNAKRQVTTSDEDAEGEEIDE